MRRRVLRGTTADEDGNVTMEEEAVFGEMLPMAAGDERCGGLVIVQGKRVSKAGTLPAKHVRYPASSSTSGREAGASRQTYLNAYQPLFAGELKTPLSEFPRLHLDARKIVARARRSRLFPGGLCNLGSGISTGISRV